MPEIMPKVWMKFDDGRACWKVAWQKPEMMQQATTTGSNRYNGRRFLAFEITSQITIETRPASR